MTRRSRDGPERSGTQRGARGSRAGARAPSGRASSSGTYVVDGGTGGLGQGGQAVGGDVQTGISQDQRGVGDNSVRHCSDSRYYQEKCAGLTACAKKT